jgi:hypothetical protein
MKKPESNAKPAETPAAKPGNVKKLHELPTPVELALIAATLARNPTTDTPRSLVDSAMELFYAARNRVKALEVLASLTPEWAKDPVFSWESFGDKGPLTRDNFLPMVLPGYKSRTADLARIGKAFLRYTLREKNQKEPTREEIADAYANWETYKNPDEANRAAHSLKEWHRQHYIREFRRAAGLRSAQAKKKRKARPRRAELEASVKEGLKELGPLT